MKLQIGPGALVAAAFIGPGTVTACTVAGADFGFALVWTLVFATGATIVLQDMSARLGAGARLGLGEALLRAGGAPLLRLVCAALVVLALAVGNAAYEAGNLAGAALGVEAMTGPGRRRLVVFLLAGLSAGVLLLGRYRPMERILVALVALMSLAFVATALIIRPDLSRIAAGLVPRIPDGGALTAVALIGTTIVPYNLFLHAAAARARWQGADAVDLARRESAVSIGLGGLVSLLILTIAASALFAEGVEVSSAADMARGIEPVFGPLARYLIGVGLFAAGLTSAITAPMATAYAMVELSGATEEALRRRVFRGVALAVVGVGAVIALLEVRPVFLILLAQAANGLLLPIVAVFLMAVMNRRSVLGEHANGLLANRLGAIVIASTVALGLSAVWRAGLSAFGG